MKDILELVPRVHEVAAACPEPTAIRHLRTAAREFCRRTRVWRGTERWKLSTETCEAIRVNQEAEVFEITHAKLDDTDLEAKTADWLDKNVPGWRDEEGPAKFITQTAPFSVRVVPKPAFETGEEPWLTLELVLVPADDTERLPDVLVDTYDSVIADGAIARVLALPNTDFQDTQLASYHAGLFTVALARWANQIGKGQMKARRRVKPSLNF